MLQVLPSHAHGLRRGRKWDDMSLRTAIKMATVISLFRVHPSVLVSSVLKLLATISNSEPSLAVRPNAFFLTNFRLIPSCLPLTAYPTSQSLRPLPDQPVRLVVIGSGGRVCVLVVDGDPLDYLGFPR